MDGCSDGPLRIVNSQWIFSKHLHSHAYWRHFVALDELGVALLLALPQPRIEGRASAWATRDIHARARDDIHHILYGGSEPIGVNVAYSLLLERLCGEGRRAGQYHVLR